MWALEVEDLSSTTLRFRLGPGVNATSFGELVQRLGEDPALRRTIVDHLRACPFEAFRWETPPVSEDHLGRAFEFVVIDAPALSNRAADPSAFRAQLDGVREPVVTFDNLGGDATLVVPTPMAPPDAYGHLAAFVREAPPEQVDALFATVGRTLLDRIGPSPLWLNTAGMGVPWLHVRLDSRPKYYGHAPYCELP